MSTRRLTELQEAIIDALANDVESISQLQEMIDGPVDRDDLFAALWTLVDDGYVLCHAESGTDLIPVEDPERRALASYWFGLSSKGDQLLHILEASD